MRFVAIAALAATFWLLVATMRLVIHEPCPRREVTVTPQRTSSPSPPLPPSLVVVTTRYHHARWQDDDDDPPDDASFPMSREGLIGGFNSVRARVQACYQKFQVPGTAMVNVVIARSGRVRSATVTGKFAGTRTGACVEAAVKTARFPRSDGLSTPYPFQLR